MKLKMTHCIEDSRVKASAFRNNKRVHDSCPYYRGGLDYIKRLVKKAGIRNVSLAPSIVSSNRKAVNADMKDKKRLGNIRNAEFYLR